MKRHFLALALLLGACTRQSAEAPPPAEPAAAVPALPAGFRVTKPPVVTEPFLPPAAAWRFLVSQLTTLRVDARAKGEDVLVTFEEGAFHATGRDGGRHTWRLPKGLRLSGVPAHLLLRADLAMESGGEEGLQPVGEEEVAVVTARIDTGEGNVQEFRLMAKGGKGFRSISTGG